MTEPSHDEHIRALERRARELNDAQSWSHYAFALARAGRSGDAQAAAHRALARDPANECRSLLVTPGECGSRSRVVGWPGLRRLSAPRRVALDHGPDIHVGFFDVGEGLLVYESRRGSNARLVAFDAVREQRRWMHASVGPLVIYRLCALGTRVALLQDPGDADDRSRALLLTVLERDTGAVREGGQIVVRVPGTGGPSNHRLSGPHGLEWLDDERLAALMVDEGALLVVAFDLRGAVLWRVRFVSDYGARIFVLAGRIIVNVGPTIHALSLDGEEAWQHSDAVVVGRRDDRLLVAWTRREGCVLSWIGAVSGELLSSSDPLRGLLSEAMSTAHGVVVSTEGEVIAFDAESLRRAWTLEIPVHHLAATADTVLAVREHPFERPDSRLREELASVVALDAASGAELGRIEVPPT
ncbi:MAG: PQQ-binding-like beta-propeller repeat protein, partial [Planctomycetota bacterium]